MNLNNVPVKAFDTFIPTDLVKGTKNAMISSHRSRHLREIISYLNQTTIYSTAEAKKKKTAKY